MPHPTHAEQRPREHLTPAEVDRLMQAAQRRGRYGHRDATLILVMAQHGFRVGEVTRLVWQAIDFTDATIQIRRLKHGRDTLQPLNGQELRALRKLKREWPETVYVFTSERGAPLSTEAVRKIVLRAGEAAKFPFPLHPHMLRHACGYRLVNAGVDTRMIQEVLGHRNIRHTEGYTALHATRFREVLGK
jgi:type 1 fimbriae regulatory protein FimB/type 1 fimbriae regulatory protein FimE